MSNNIPIKEFQRRLSLIRDVIDQLTQSEYHGLLDYRIFCVKRVANKKLPTPCEIKKCSYCGVYGGISSKDDIENHFAYLLKKSNDLLVTWSLKDKYSIDYYSPSIIYLTLKKLSLLNTECMCPSVSDIEKLPQSDWGFGQNKHLMKLFANNYRFFRMAIDFQLTYIGRMERSLARGLLTVGRKSQFKNQLINYLPKLNSYTTSKINMLHDALELAVKIGLLKKQTFEDGDKEYYLLDNLYKADNRLCDDVDTKRVYILLIARLSENLSIGRRIKDDYHNISWRTFEPFFGKEIIKSCKVRLANHESPADLKANNYKKFENTLGARIVDQINQVADSCLFGGLKNNHPTTT